MPHGYWMGRLSTHGGVRADEWLLYAQEAVAIGLAGAAMLARRRRA